MMNRQKSKKQKPIDLGPLNIAKTQYRPYFGGLPRREKQNIRTMGPLQNIMFDIPKIQEATDNIQISPIQKLRMKICKQFQQKSTKLKQQWIFYIRKSEIVGAANSAWTEVETYLLKIITQLFSQCKIYTQANAELQKFKQNAIQSQANNNFRSLDQTKLCEKLNKTNYNATKVDYSMNDCTVMLRNSISKSKGFGRSQYKQNSMHNGADELMSYTQGISSPDIVNSLQFKISKLEKQILLYQDKIRYTEKQYKEKLNQMEKKKQVEIGAKYNQTMQEKMKYQNQVESKRFYNDILAQQFKVLKKKYIQLETEHESMKNKYSKTKKQNQKMTQLYQYRELWLMQHEQISELNRQIYHLKQEKQSQIKKNKGLKQKLKELSKNFNYNYNVSMQNQKDKQDLNKVLKDFRDWLKFFAVPRVSKGMMNNNTFFPQMNIESGKQSYSGLLPKDDQTNYKLLRPNFFIYFQSYEGIILAERKFPQRKVMPPSYYLTIRAIFDALFLHFNFTPDFKQWHNFPEFAISFIQKFQINQQTKKPMLRRATIQSEQKINFILNVFNIQAANSWQCEIFRSFVMEQFTLDQIYFYLECRDTLLKGSQLNNNFGSSDGITYIKVAVAEEVIRDKLRNYDRQMLERMKKFLNSKKKIKYNKQLIDVNFVLKLLLQVYSIQKIKSQRFFHHNFKSKNPSTKISYTQYSAFMTKNFDFLTKNDIAKLYREMYTLGVSHITYKTIHYVCSMRGLFIPLLKAKMSVKNQLWHSDPKYPKVFEDALFLDLQNSVNNMLFCAQQFGLEEIVDRNVYLNKFLHQTQNLRQNRPNFQYRLLHQTEKLLKVRSILAWKTQKYFEYDQLSRDDVRQKLGNLLTIVNQSFDDINSMKKWKQNREKALAKLTRNFKIRIQQSLAQFKAIDKKQYEKKLAKMQQVEKKAQAEQQSEKQQKENENEDQNQQQ